MKTRHDYGNQPEGYSELEEEIAEDINFQKDNRNAKAAFLSDQHHDVLPGNVPGNVTSGGVWAEPPLEGLLDTDFIDRRKTAITNRRHVTTKKQRSDSSH